MIGGLLGGSLAVLFSVDTLRMRRRARALGVLSLSDEPVSATHVFLVRPGVVVDEATKRAASAYARRHGLSVLDLVPQRMASWRAVVLLSTTDPATYRADRIAAGATACDAILVDADVLARAREGGDFRSAPENVVDFLVTARVLKRYATTASDLAVAPALDSPGIPLHERRRLLRMLFTDLVTPVLAAEWALLAAAIVASPVAGLAALGIFQTQALAGTFGTPLAPKDRVLYAALRIAVDAASTLGPSAPPPAPRVTSESLRSTYAELLAKGSTTHFEPARNDCPICGSDALRALFTIGDRHQHKPGSFTLSRCAGCGHVFQNPRLSIDGLSFYYRDFYDGLGQDKLEYVFASGPARYLARAQMVASLGTPRRWLDVGAGQGHFCNVARDVLPDTKFDGLDLNDAILGAERRGWVNRGIRGLFPDVAPTLVTADERYDVVSMSHYLEHTLDPRAEIGAAAKVLTDGGLFLIEVPNPDSAFAKLLGRHWMPWFQPQHLHLLNRENLERLLREAGFEPVAWDDGAAHQASDFFYVVLLALEGAAPSSDVPWLAPAGAATRVGRRTAWALAAPALAAAWTLDHVLARFASKRPSWSNAFRVVARKR